MNTEDSARPSGAGNGPNGVFRLAMPLALVLIAFGLGAFVAQALQRDVTANALMFALLADALALLAVVSGGAAWLLATARSSRRVESGSGVVGVGVGGGGEIWGVDMAGALGAAGAAPWALDLDTLVWSLPSSHGDQAGPVGAGRRLAHNAWLKGVHAAEAERVAAAFAALVDGSAATLDLRFRLCREDGAVASVECRGGVVEKASGPRMALGLMRDITAEIALSEQGRAANDRKAAAIARQEFLAVVSHEVRTPMNGVLGLSRLLLESNLTGEQRDYAETIASSGENLLCVINDILDLSKMEAGKLQLDPVAFESRSLVDHCLAIMAPAATEKGIALAACVASNVPLRGTADRGRLQQIIVSLLGNAIKYTAQGGVTLRVHTGPAETDGACRLVVTIRDSGIGIPEAQQETMFSGVDDADVTISARYNGKGLGLAVARRLCNAMGGTISLHSQLDVGTTVTFDIVLDQCGLADAPPVPVDRPVLVIEPEELIRDTMVAALEMRGVSVITNPGEAGGADVAVVVLSHRSALDRDEVLAEAAEYGMQVAETVAYTPSRAQANAHLFVEPLRAIDYDAIANAARNPLDLQRLEPPRPIEATRDPLGRDGRQGRSLLVLVVEDNAVNQKVASRVLEKNGHRVLVAENGQIALEMRAQHPIDVVLMDRHMPVMDGVACTADWRALDVGAGRHMPIIGLTASVAEQDVRECLAAGMDSVLHKPFNPDDLFAEIDRLLPDTAGEQWTGPEAEDSGAPAAAKADPEMPAAHGPTGDSDDLLAQEMSELDSLRDILGDEEVAELFTTFQTSCTELSAELQAALAAGDVDVVRRCAHTAKSSARVMGFLALGHFAERIEDCCRPEGDHGAGMADAGALATALDTASRVPSPIPSTA